jgi:hypothetical protein
VTGFKVDELEGCQVVTLCRRSPLVWVHMPTVLLTLFLPFIYSRLQGALLGVICAYHFPKCKHDLWEQERICMRTCQNMIRKCQVFRHLFSHAARPSQLADPLPFHHRERPVLFPESRGHRIGHSHRTDLKAC